MTAPLRPVTPLGILAATLGRLVDEVDDLGGDVDPDWSARLRGAWRLAAGLEPYAAACTSPESSALRRLGELTQGASHLEREMLSGHVEGRLLGFLVRMTRARRVLEVGMFTGYSALAMAEALPDDGVVVACEIDPAVAEIAQEGLAASPHGAKVDVRVGPAATTLRQLADEGAEFDLVFIDADKPGYGGYLDLLLDTGLLAAGATVCVDNTLLQGEPYLEPRAGAGRSTNGAAIAEFNRKVADDARIEQVLLPVRDGVTLLRCVGHDG